MLVAAWSLLCVCVSWRPYGGVWPYAISYTGWSWVLLTARAACTAGGALLGPSSSLVGAALSTAGSALHFPAIACATVTFTLWNLVLFPMLLCVLPPSGTPAALRNQAKGGQFTDRRTFLQFNFSFFMTNLHVCNLPLAACNVVYGAGARPLVAADLWLAFLLAGLYAFLYLGLLDRMGAHLYPMFSPRSPLCVVAYLALFSLYYGIFHACNALVA